MSLDMKLLMALIIKVAHEWIKPSIVYFYIIASREILKGFKANVHYIGSLTVCYS